MLKSDQHQFSLNNIHTSPREKVRRSFDLVMISSNVAGFFLPTILAVFRDCSVNLEN